MEFPAFDPVAFQIGPLAVRWYALAYLGGFIFGWLYAKRLTRKFQGRPNALDFDDFLTWAVIGVILGGRIGYILFYNFTEYLADPLAIFAVWRGGMSFHGGLIGMIAAILLFCRARSIPLLRFGDVIACVVPIGIFLGRIANFINGELWGRTADVPWAIVFPGAGPLPRHPSQLYEALLEGVLLFALLWLLARSPRVWNKPGILCGTFLLGYGAARLFVEHFREPDAQLGFLLGGLTMGQWLSVPMLAIGLILIFRPKR